MKIVSIDDLKEEYVNEFLTIKGLYKDDEGFERYRLMTDSTYNKIAHMLELEGITIQEWIETQYQSITISFMDKEYDMEDYSEIVKLELESEIDEQQTQIDFVNWQDEIDGRIQTAVSLRIQEDIKEEIKRLNDLGYCV